MAQFTVHYVFDVVMETGNRPWEHHIEEALEAPDVDAAGAILMERLAKPQFMVEDKYGDHVVLNTSNIRCCRIAGKAMRSVSDSKPFTTTLGYEGPVTAPPKIGGI